MSIPREYIEDIKNRQIKSDKEFILDSLTGAIDRLQKAFPRYGSFLMEFVQNADDAKSSSLKIEILQGAVRIFNNGIPFSEEDVKSICKVGRSSKTPKDYIGYLGVGFKAVFLISQCPAIYSGDFRFKFDKNVWDDSAHTPWQVIPLWIDNPQVRISEKYKTIFNLPLKEVKLLEKLSEEVKPEHLNNRILLFLRNVKEIEIADLNKNFKRRVIKSEVSKTSDYGIYQIQEDENDDFKNQDRWVIFRSFCIVPKEVKEDYVTKEWERENVDKREVLIAFKIDEENNLIKEEKGTAHIGVFSFLPLTEIPSGLNFLIQADFLTTPGRGELARECLWNNWLVGEIYNLIIKKCIPSLIKHEKWRMNYTEILYSSEGGHELFESHIKRPLRKYLENNAVLIAADGSLLKPDDAVIIRKSFREYLEKKFISEDDLKKLYPDKKVLAANCKIPWDIEKIVKKGPNYDASYGIDNETQRLIKLEAEQKNIAFFKEFYSELSKYAKSNIPYLQSSSFHSQDLLLTDTWELVAAGVAYIKPSNISIPKEVKENFKVIHPELSADTTISPFLTALGVEELTTEHIQNILNKKEIPIMGRDWTTFLDNEKVEKIKLCKTLWKDNQIEIRNLNFLTLKAKSGKWVKPEEIIFPKEYKPEHNIGILTEKGLYDLPIEFVSTEFIKEKGDEEIKEWYKFLKELGVDKKVEQEKSSIVQRIGIKTAMKFEEDKKRHARVLDESEKLGYDIESEERCIEVKSSRKSQPDIFITTNEFRTLQEKRGKYFVYVVKDALRYPTLCVTQGDKLLSITDIKMIIPFNKWSSEAKDEEFQP